MAALRLETFSEIVKAFEYVDVEYTFPANRL